MTMDPTPPAAASTSSVPVLSAPSRNRSNSVSHAVMPVSGSAAAWAKVSVRGLCPVIRSSASWNWASLPARPAD
jgi:hypothetical protein